MEINRQTYESVFLLYIDNELTCEERLAVETFLEENPDLKPEMEMLKETILIPDGKLVFNNKERLLKISSPNPVNELNYEEFFVLYGDDELNISEKEYTEQFVYKNPQYQAEFELILNARLTADPSVLFPDKNLLYHSEKEERVVGFRWWKIAVAAALILCVGGIGWYYSSTPVNSYTPVVKVTNDPAIMKTENPDIENIPVPRVENKLDPDEQIASSEKGHQKANTIGNKSNTIIQESVPTNKQFDIANKNVENNSEEKSNKAAELYVEQSENRHMAINTDKIPDAEKATYDKRIADAIKTAAIGGEETASTELQAPVVFDPELDNSNVIYVANTEVSKKNKLRGIFRTASRIFEKTTSFQPSGKDKGIRIANFEIELK